MNIIEVKNNLVKICYEDDLLLSGLLLIKDNMKSYIAQILHLEATRIGKVAIAKILFNYVDKLYTYDGSIPSLRADIQILNTTFLLDSLEHSNPLSLGKIAGHKDNLTVDFNILKDNPIILAEKFYVTKVLLNNLAIQLQGRKNKIVVFDTAGVFKANKLTITKDFKLPLNSSTINYIYEKGFEDATAESKALIQSIFEELGEYSKTVDFIPFDTFKAVVDSEFMRTKLMQLIIMKNKIKQIRDWNVFAQNTAEFEVLKNKLSSENTVVIDISPLKDSLQQECIKYVYSILKDINAEFYAFTPLSNDSASKFLLSEIINTENVHTSIICNYNYPYLDELKKCSKNMFMFTPLKQQKDFGGYNIFLQKLAEDEFIAYGKMTKFVPIIGRLTQLAQSDIYIPKVKETISQITKPQQEIVSETPTVQDVQETVVNESPVVQDVQETVVDEAPVVQDVQETIVDESPVVQDVQETVVDEAPVVQDVQETVVDEAPAVQDIQETVVEETPAVQDVQETVVEETPAVQDIQETVVEETPAVQDVQETVVEETPVVQDVQEPVVEETPVVQDIQETVVEETSVVQDAQEPVKEEIQEDIAEVNEVENALNEVEEIDDDEELSDDDLDMIEELSKPDEDIEILNEEVQPATSETVQPQEVIEEPIVQQAAEPQVHEDEEIQNATIPKTVEPLQTRANTNPAVPEYSAEIPEEDKVNSDALQQGDRVFHQEFGEGVVEKMINYGDKILCSINFASVGRRLLNPEISEMKRI